MSCMENINPSQLNNEDFVSFCGTPINWTEGDSYRGRVVFNDEKNETITIMSDRMQRLTFRYTDMDDVAIENWDGPFEYFSMREE